MPLPLKFPVSANRSGGVSPAGEPLFHLGDEIPRMLSKTLSERATQFVLMLKSSANRLIYLVPQEGFEPPTPSLRMMCSFAGVAGIYQRHQFEPEKRAALERSANHIERIVV